MGGRRACGWVGELLEDTVVARESEPSELVSGSVHKWALSGGVPLGEEFGGYGRVAEVVVGPVCVDGPLVGQQRVVLEILADVGEVDDWGDALGLQFGRVADSGEEEDLWCADRPC